MASLASAALITGNVTWDVVGGQLVGTGTALGDVDLNIALSSFGTVAGTVDPDPTTDGNPGAMLIAGDKGNVIDWGTYYNVIGGDLVGSGQALGVWYRLDINAANLGAQTIDVYDNAFGYIGSIPEPMTLALLGLGGLFLRRKK